MSSDQNLFHYITLFLLLLSLPICISSQFLTSPYGKHYISGSKRTISPPFAWFFMESPTLWLTLLLFPFGQNYSNPLAYILISPYVLHYFNRTIIYPLRLYFTTNQQKTTNGFPLDVALTGFIFNILNAYIQTRWVSHYANYDSDKLFWLRFGGGVVVFAIGMMVNVWADGVLVGLKRQGGGYKIPRGWLYEYVSCPNYFGEIMEWLGWALMTWSLAGLAFFSFTCANLVPRALSNHKWYLEKFAEDYPRKRKAVFPLLY